ncbi:MAG: thiamine phosphate synthase [Cytophagaceae bacterium]|nr:MAG: thiamine phosphate synthase [Cytophagaceae bacterium]
MPFQLVVISAAEYHSTELAVLPQLFEAGLAVFHVRKPAWSRAEMAAYLQAIPGQYHGRLVLHAHYELALHYPVKGIHLTEKARQDAAIGRLLLQLPGRSVSASFHSLAAVSQHRRRYDYVFLSPVFDSLSKAGYASGLDLAEVAAFLPRLAARPGYRPAVLALGGIAAQNLRLVRQAGFAGAAALGTIWQSPDPVAAFWRLQAAAT